MGCQGTKVRRRGSEVRRGGFTLLEAMLTTVIIATGVTALLVLLATGSVANADSAAITNAVQLAENIRELTVRLRFNDDKDPNHFGPESGETLADFDDVDDLHGFSSAGLGGPIDGRRQVIVDQANWVQQVEVATVDENNVLLTSAPGSQPLVRVTVTVRRNEEKVHRASWIVSTIK
jgi:Tfp pilus assembly protein PilV